MLEPQRGLTAQANGMQSPLAVFSHHEELSVTLHFNAPIKEAKVPALPEGTASPLPPVCRLLRLLS